ncbi:lim homeobox 2/9 protein [Saccoglossus kowalevskii]|uniref:Lim homeobox 2/9 protein n=1 Tax=Saccoglossus kowalevskii TaxID=10224 RepID=B5M229_SACKO|nr:lim homeobox 2/9 protein [Saccoglossus kowalevskii]ACH68441.1 lim homeobox 2/9 protein [Saccoglossus kowalevskii]
MGIMEIGRYSPKDERDILLSTVDVHKTSVKVLDGNHDAGQLEIERTMPVINRENKPCICAGCGGRILDRYYLLAVDKQWHMQCLKCCECKLRLDSELTCFAKDGSIYCKDDYYRRFSVKRCARCHLGISASEMVMRARDLVYHLSCFTCATCNKALATGDHFGMKDAMVYCRSHYEAMLHTEHVMGLSPYHHQPSPMPGASPTQHTPYYNGVGAVQKGRPRKRKSPNLENDYHTQGYPHNDSENHQDLNSDQYTQQRTKRMRTSFKHHQLRTMKSYFALNHNPDAKDLKQLAQKTGLTKRVLHVWFQNARAKYRRSLSKGKDGDGNNNNTINDSGTTLTDLSASTPGTGSMSDLTAATPPGLQTPPPGSMDMEMEMEMDMESEHLQDHDQTPNISEMFNTEL